MRFSLVASAGNHVESSTRVEKEACVSGFFGSRFDSHTGDNAGWAQDWQSVLGIPGLIGLNSCVGSA